MTDLNKKKKLLSWFLDIIDNNNIENYNDKYSSSDNNSESSLSEFEYESDSNYSDDYTQSKEINSDSYKSTDTNHGILDIFFKYNNKNSYLKENNDRYEEICSNIQEDSAKFNNSESTNLFTENNNLIESLQWSIQCLNEKMDKILSINKPSTNKYTGLLEYTEMIEQNSSSSSENVNTIQLWNKIEKNVKKNNNNKNIFIFNEKNKKNFSKKNNKNMDNIVNSRDNNLNPKDDIISDYIIRNNSEEDTYQNNLYDYYLPRYKQKNKN